MKYMGFSFYALDRKDAVMSNGKDRGCLLTLLDFVLVICTGGLWLIWILIRYLRANS